MKAAAHTQHNLLLHSSSQGTEVTRLFLCAGPAPTCNGRNPSDALASLVMMVEGLERGTPSGVGVWGGVPEIGAQRIAAHIIEER